MSPTPCVITCCMAEGKLFRSSSPNKVPSKIVATLIHVPLVFAQKLSMSICVERINLCWMYQDQAAIASDQRFVRQTAPYSKRSRLKHGLRLPTHRAGAKTFIQGIREHCHRLPESEL